MPAGNNTALAGKPTVKEESHCSTTRKPSSARPQEPAVRCPRCDSPNTKFCYYNNYSLAQPRHFCKTCRRYWTKGGALRNVPIGGGCRKNKRMKSSPRLSGDSHSSSDLGGLKFFQGLSPAMDFHPAGINIPKYHMTSNTNVFSQFPPFGDLSNTSSAISESPCFNLDPSLMGFGFPLASSLKQGQEMGSVTVHGNLASSIESLSTINQDLHWSLQQQRLATLFVDEGQKETSGNIDKQQPIQFQNLENPKADSCLIGTSSKDATCSTTEWFFSNSYAPEAPTNWNTGIQAWNELHSLD